MSELQELKGQSQSSHEAPLLAAPGAMISTLARRVASQLGADTPTPAPSADSLEESMRKVNKYVGTHSFNSCISIGLTSVVLLVLC